MASCCAEVEALAAIFCGKGESELKSINGRETIFVITPPQTGEFGLSLICTHNGETIFQISVQSCKLNRAQMEGVNTAVKAEAARLSSLGHWSVILSLIDWLVEYFHKEKETVTEKAEGSKQEEEPVLFTYVLQLDHIRNTSMYTKTLSRWFGDHNLLGVLIYYNRYIFLLVSGDKKDLLSYLKLHRTQCIDVDSSGRPCKERLLSFLGQVDQPLNWLSSTSQRLSSLHFEKDNWQTFWHGNSTSTLIYHNFIRSQTETIGNKQ